MRKTVVDGKTYEVPVHVSRVDSWKTSSSGREKSGWHGWQVRWPGTRKFFSDSKFGNPRQSFLRAVDYASLYPGKKHQCKVYKGVTLHKAFKKDRNKYEYYVEASHPVHGKSPKRYYVGTESTITLARVREQWKEARKHRLELIEQHIQEKGLIRDYGEAPDF